MRVYLPRGIDFDIDRIPDDFDDVIVKAFKEYAKGTAAAYVHHDKLSFIDLCRDRLHGITDSEEEVNKLIKERFECEIDEYGEIMDTDDFFTKEFMVVCYDAGNVTLYDDYTGDRKSDDKIMNIMYRIIKLVIGCELEDCVAPMPFSLEETE